jgi:hypothetical protein
VFLVVYVARGWSANNLEIEEGEGNETKLKGEKI